MGIVGTSLNLGARPNESNEDLERTLGRSRSWMPRGILGDRNTDRKAGICLRCHFFPFQLKYSIIHKFEY